ncbi:unnamed protein product, partial [Ixodes hexagonus]
GDLQYHVTAGDASQILTDPRNESKAIRVNKLLDLKNVLVVGATAEGIDVSEFESADGDSFKEIPVPDPKATVVALGFTAGTAGLPKAVEISQHSFVASLQTSRVPLSENREDVILAWEPIAQMSGFLFTLPAAFNGSTCVLASPSLSFEKLVHVVNQYKVTL